MTTLPSILRPAFALLAAAAITHAAPIPDECKTNGFAIGCQAYTFNRFTVFEAIEKTAEAGGKVIEFYPGQKLSKEEPDVKWNHDASDEVVAKVQAKLAQHKIKAVNYGVVGIPKEEEGARKIFLEVGIDNDGARSLYSQAGFEEVGRRAGYYTRPAGFADALVLRLVLNDAG